MARIGDDKKAREWSPPHGVEEGIGPPPLPPPPDYDGSRTAADVFADPYFYDSESDAARREPARREALGDVSVRQAFQNSFAQNGVEAIASLGKAIRARELQLRHYYNGEGNPTKQRFVAPAIEGKYECRLREALLPVGAITSALAPLIAAPGDSAEEGDGADDPSHEDVKSRIVDLSFLDALKAKDDDDVDDERFLAANQMYARDCMRRVFALFREDAIARRRPPGKKDSAILVGSPGVGASTLFFLAALHQATQSSNVVYYRRPGEGPASVFVLTLDGGRRNVRVWFSRNVKTELLGPEALITLSTDLKRSRVVDVRTCYTFVDGPKYGDVPNTLDGNYDYLRPSGGFPMYPNEEKRKRLWILDGWTEREAIRYLVHVKRDHVAEGRDGVENRARKAYGLCGGSIRDMLDALDNEALVMSTLNARLRHLDSSGVDLSLISTDQGNEDKSNPDRLRTMFWERKSVQDPRMRMCGFQVVDSRYALNHLRLTLDVDKVYNAYALLRGSVPQTGPEGCFFALAIHRIVHSKCSLPEGSLDRLPNVRTVRWSEGETWEAATDALCEPSVYWVPSLTSFSSVDSAIVHHNTLYAFLMRVSRDVTFDIESFRRFEAAVRSKAPFSGLRRRAVVCFVRPAGTGLGVPDRISNVVFRSYEVDTDSLDGLSASLRGLLAFV